MELNSPLDIVKCSQTISAQVMEGGAAYNDGRISVGDRLVAVKKLPTGDFYLDNCTHEESVQVTGGCQLSLQGREVQRLFAEDFSQ